MPAKLELLPRKAFSLTFSDDTTVEGQFGTWALARFGQRKKLSLAQIITLFDEPQIMDVLEFVLCALEYKEREAAKPSFMTEIKLSRWIDEYSYETGETGVLMKLWAHANSTDVKELPDGEKKTEGSLRGVNSSELSMQEAEV